MNCGQFPRAKFIYRFPWLCTLTETYLSRNGEWHKMFESKLNFVEKLRFRKLTFKTLVPNMRRLFKLAVQQPRFLLIRSVHKNRTEPLLVTFTSTFIWNAPSHRRILPKTGIHFSTSYFIWQYCPVKFGFLNTNCQWNCLVPSMVNNMGFTIKILQKLSLLFSLLNHVDLFTCALMYFLHVVS